MPLLSLRVLKKQLFRSFHQFFLVRLELWSTNYFNFFGMEAAGIAEIFHISQDLIVNSGV